MILLVIPNGYLGTLEKITRSSVEKTPSPSEPLGYISATLISPGLNPPKALA